jgi:hypothetical protein
MIAWSQQIRGKAVYIPFIRSVSFGSVQIGTMFMKMSKRKQVIAISGSLGLLATAAGLSAMAIPERGGQAKAADPDVTGLLRERSPGLRMAGAETNKYSPVPMSAIRPISAPPLKVVEEPETPAPKVAMLTRDVIPPVPGAAAPAYVPEAAIAPPPVVAAPALGASQAPVPATALVPAVGAAAGVPIAAAAVGSSGIGAAALLPVIPAAFAVGAIGGGGDSSITPAVPEPQTWMMMITGFGLLGLALRRRRRRERSLAQPVAQPA